jgi:magnesium transporter
VRESDRIVSEAPTQPLLGEVLRLTERAVPRATGDDTVGQVIAALHGGGFATVAAVAVLDGERLVGLVRIEDLLAAPAATAIREIMDPSPPAVSHDVDQERAAWPPSTEARVRWPWSGTTADSSG